jgi:UDP-N-acetylglucosamine--N-acetylmuramyl-(pentapeptide) pyrophosphoryl-undecaprenol N-acetylglucosamine transferase
MKIILTGGGTAGHITPNIALLPGLRANGFSIDYIGLRGGMEAQLIAREGVPFHGIRAGKLRRYLDVKNMLDLGNTAMGFAQALRILRAIKPDVVFSKGGFVSCPVVWAARLRHIPVVLHESDITPGLANQLCLPFAEKVCVAFPETLPHLPPGKGVLTGLPIRAALLAGDAAQGRALCRFGKEKPVLMVIGGSQGAECINTMIRATLPILTREFQLCHIVGKGNLRPELQASGKYCQFEYVSDELPHLFAMADLVISRAGATTLFELLALRKPHLLIPLAARASRGDQILNAASFEKQGFSRVLPEEQLEETTFLHAVRETYRERQSYLAAMERVSAVSAADAVITVIRQVVESNGKR